MTLRVSGKNLDIGLAFRTHIETRIDSVLTKYRAVMVAGHVTVEPEGSGFRADCTLHLSSGATLQADAKAQEPYASFNRAADLVENQIRRHRERLTDRHGSAAADDKTMIDHESREEAPLAALEFFPGGDRKRARSLPGCHRGAIFRVQGNDCIRSRHGTRFDQRRACGLSPGFRWADQCRIPPPRRQHRLDRPRPGMKKPEAGEPLPGHPHRLFTILSP